MINKAAHLQDAQDLTGLVMRRSLVREAAVRRNDAPAADLGVASPSGCRRESAHRLSTDAPVWTCLQLS